MATGNAGQSSVVAHVVSGFCDAVRPGVTRGKKEKEGASTSYERRDVKRGATELNVARGGDKAPYEVRRVKFSRENEDEDARKFLESLDEAVVDGRMANY